MRTGLGVKFPANREINREFCDFRPIGAVLVANQRANSISCSEIPYTTEQGIFWHVTGKHFELTGYAVRSLRLCRIEFSVHTDLIMAAISHVFTIARVAEMLGEDEDLLQEICIEMDPEDGCLTVLGPGEETIAAFTRFGVDNLTELVNIYKADPGLLRRFTPTE